MIVKLKARLSKKLTVIFSVGSPCREQRIVFYQQWKNTTNKTILTVKSNVLEKHTEIQKKRYSNGIHWFWVEHFAYKIEISKRSLSYTMLHKELIFKIKYSLKLQWNDLLYARNFQLMSVLVFTVYNTIINSL